MAIGKGKGEGTGHTIRRASLRPKKRAASDKRCSPCRTAGITVTLAKQLCGTCRGNYSAS